MKFRTLLFAASMLSTSGTCLAQARSNESPPDQANAEQIDVIVVTAQRRSENVQDVPVSVATITGDKIGPGGAQTSLDLAKHVVGLQLNQVFAGSNPTIFVRGVGVNDYNPASSGAVGVMIDDVFLNSGVGQLFQLYDLDRVEVLRGPQGTLFGRNTTGGVLNFTTRKPTFTPSVNASVSYGRFNEFDAELGLGGPIAGDVLAGRVSVKYNRRDGYILNLVDGQKQNDFDTLAGRAHLLFQPTDNLDIDLKVEGGRRNGSAIRAKSGGIFNLAEGRPCTGEEILQLNVCANPLSGYVESADLDVAQVNVTNNSEPVRNFSTKFGINWDFGGATLTAISAYVRNKRDLNQDQDSSPFQILEGRKWQQVARQFSQEIRLASNGSNRFNWIVGGYFLTEKLTEESQTDLAAAFAPPAFNPAIGVLGLQKNYTQRTTSLAGFAQASYELTDALTLTGGIRYTSDRKKLDFRTYAGPVGSAPGDIPPIIGLIDSDSASFAIDPPVQINDRFSEPTWRLSLDYKASDNLLFYGSYNRGFRSGGYNTGALSDPGELSFVRPEKIDAFELGFKSDLAGRKLRINGAAFYYKLKDQQVFSLEPGTPVPFQKLQNADSEIYGGELEVTARPTRGLDFSGGIALLHARYTKLIDTVRGDLSGNTLDKAPSLQLNGRISYEFDVSNDLTATAGVDGSYQSKVYLNPINQAPLVTDGYGLLNARFSVASQSGLIATAWVKNLTNERYLQDAFDLSSYGSISLIYNEPRTYGVTLAYEL